MFPLRDRVTYRPSTRSVKLWVFTFPGLAKATALAGREHGEVNRLLPTGGRFEERRWFGVFDRSRSHGVLTGVVVADLDLHAGQPGPAAVLPVDHGDGGDDVGVQQVHRPPGVVLLGRVRARPVSEVALAVPVDGAVGVPERVVVVGGLARFPTQGHVFCQTTRGGRDVTGRGRLLTYVLL